MWGWCNIAFLWFGGLVCGWVGFPGGVACGLPFPWRVVWYGGFGVLWLILMWWVGYAGFGVLWVVCDYVGFDAVLDFRLLRCFPEGIRFVWVV